MGHCLSEVPNKKQTKQIKHICLIQWESIRPEDFRQDWRNGAYDELHRYTGTATPCSIYAVAKRTLFRASTAPLSACACVMGHAARSAGAKDATCRCQRATLG